MALLDNKTDYISDAEAAAIIAEAQDASALKDVALPYVTLKSSTANSTKKFKITVIDAGTLSATEIS